MGGGLAYSNGRMERSQIPQMRLPFTLAELDAQMEQVLYHLPFAPMEQGRFQELVLETLRAIIRNMAVR